MPVTISPIRLRYLLVVVAFVAFVSAMLLRTAIVQAEDAGAARAAAELAAAVDAGAPPIVDAGTAAVPAPPLPADPAAAPGDALDGFRLWWRTGWVYAVLFGIGSLLIGLGARVTYLRTGKAAIALGTAIAAVVAVLAGKLAGVSDAQAVAGALNVVLAGVFWVLWPNRSTVDLSTATPEKIAAALQAANKPPAFPAAAPPA